MLSNAVWILRQVDRASNDDTANVYYRCGSQQGKVAARVRADVGEAEFDALTVHFVATCVTEYRKLRVSGQKNATRNLKKYFDAVQVSTIVEGVDAVSIETLASSILKH